MQCRTTTLGVLISIFVIYQFEFWCNGKHFDDFKFHNWSPLSAGRWKIGLMAAHPGGDRACECLSVGVRLAFVSF